MSDEKTLFWDVDSVVKFSQETKVVEVLGRSVEIKKLPASIMLKVESGDTLEVMQAGLVKPSLTKEQFALAPASLVKKIVDEIVKFSGLSQDQAEKN